MENPIDQPQISSQAPVISPEPLSQPSLQPLPLNQNKNTLYIVVIVLLLALLAMGGVVFYLLQKQTKIVTSEVIPSSSPMAQAESSLQLTADETASWKTYTNSIYGFEFRYPSKYVESTDSSGWPHSLVLLSLAKGQSYSLIVEHWVKLADFQQTYSSKTYFKDFTIFNNPKGGVITILNLDKVDAPNDPDPEKVISTFKFTDVLSANTEALQTIKELTKPMVWSTPKADTAKNAAGQQFTGTSMTAAIPEKSYDKLAPFLATESDLTKNYGWIGLLEESADGPTGGMVGFKKVNADKTQTILIRYSFTEKQYTVFASN